MEWNTAQQADENNVEHVETRPCSFLVRSGKCITSVLVGVKSGLVSSSFFNDREYSLPTIHCRHTILPPIQDASKQWVTRVNHFNCIAMTSLITNRLHSVCGPLSTGNYIYILMGLCYLWKVIFYIVRSNPFREIINCPQLSSRFFDSKVVLFCSVAWNGMWILWVCGFHWQWVWWLVWMSEHSEQWFGI